MSALPTDDVLIARGKYSTLSSEKRELLKAMRGDLETISSCASRVIRAPNDMEFMGEQANALAALAEKVQARVVQVAALQEHIDAIKPIAWGGKAIEHE